LTISQQNQPVDFLVAGSGLSGLVFAALAAQSGARVRVIEAHDVPGGYGHTFQMGRSAKFNAQLHYVWNCGEGDTVNLVLKQLGLAEEVTFERMDEAGFDHMHIPGYSLAIPANNKELARRLNTLAPGHDRAINGFLRLVARVAGGLDFIASPKTLSSVSSGLGKAITTARYQNATLQQVFDGFGLPLHIQSLLASQWPDFLLPPEKLSFFAWVMLFTGYQRGAYYPTHHFESVIDALVSLIEKYGGVVSLNTEVTDFCLSGDIVTGVMTRNCSTGERLQYSSGTVVANIDPRQVANMIGLGRFSPRVQRRLDYDYSPSNFMIYATVQGIDLRDYGFGQWNTFHNSIDDINEAFSQMHDKGDYSQPSFAITTPGMMTDDASDRPQGEQIIEFLTVADFNQFRLLAEDRGAYLQKKREIVDAIFDVVEAHYIPEFRRHVSFKVSGSPTTNARFCRAPMGNSYGSILTPENVGRNRLSHDSSITGLVFCNASAGYPGFAGAFWNGRSAFRKLL
jgi:all-trans-retinol 13,14-reductase